MLYETLFELCEPPGLYKYIKSISESIRSEELNHERLEPDFALKLVKPLFDRILSTYDPAELEEIYGKTYASLLLAEDITVFEDMCGAGRKSLFSPHKRHSSSSYNENYCAGRKPSL